MKSTKHLLLIIFALISISVNAQETVSLTINVETAGTLPDLIPYSRKYEITNLTLTGFLNGTDIRYIREMAGRNASDKPTEGKLSVLDLSKAQIVAGGDAYYFGSSFEARTSLNSIGNYTFKNCRLTSIVLPSNVTTIGYKAFEYCTGLTSVTLPDSLTSIGGHSFWSLYKLTSITFPNSLTTIEASAFGGCTGLTSLTIPSNLKAIKEAAFMDCTNIKQIICEGTTPPSIFYNTFSSRFYVCTLYVPKGAFSAYKNAPVWREFRNIIEQVTTSLSNIESRKTNVYTENGSIVVKGGKLGDTVDIYSISGSLLHKIKITDDIVRISVAPQSLYIVKAGDRSFKIAMQ